jgi:hypothetical protein
MTTPAASAEARCARLPAASLAFLAGLRTHAGLRVCLRPDGAWVWWDGPDRDMLHRVLALHGADVFERRGGHWFAPGRSLPHFGVPDPAEARPLLGVLTPDRVEPAAYAGPPPAPVALSLVRDDRTRPATALACPLAELTGWVESATSRQLAELKAAHCPEGTVLVRGRRLPPLAAGERFWGTAMLVPLGLRPEPDASEEVLRAALGLGAGDVGLWSGEGVEVIDGRAFGPLTRAGVRLAREAGVR